jgi:N-acetylmuramoyl-L-alanine amidase
LAQGRRDRFSQGAAPRGRAIPVLLLGSMLLSTGVAQAAPAHDAAGAVPVAVPAGSKCDRTKFRIILDVGHTAESYGAMSARNVPEFEYNLNLGKRIDERLKVDGFTETVLLVTEGKARPSLAARVARANRRGADLFVSIHHDSVPGIYVEKWEFEGKKGAFNDMFGGYSVFVSKQNPHYAESLRFARLLGNQMAAKDLQFARQYDQWFMGKFQRELLDIEAGVYRYDQLIVLKNTVMPAVLLESGSIINRDEELVMASDEHKNKVAAAMSSAVLEYCATRGPAPPPVATSHPKPAKPVHRLAQPPKPAAARTARKR